MKIFIYLIVIISAHIGYCQYGVIEKTNDVFEGYSLFHPNGSTDSYLINNDGELVHTWPGNFLPGVAIYLLENGQLLRSGRVDDGNDFAGGRGGRLELVEWDGTVSWSFEISSSSEKLHHDMQILPNGNILAIVWEVKTNEDAIEKGRNPNTINEAIWPDKIIELKPIGSNDAEIVWEWHAWDHTIQDFDPEKSNYGVVSENPGKIDINYDSDDDPDWLHFNALSYNEELDQILISVPEFDELWIIDHSTTTEEAATSSGGNSGKGGEILYRWGNPQTYDRGANADKKLFYQHNTTWLFEDSQWKVLLYNNGRTRPEGFYSSVDKVILPIDANNNYPALGTATEPYGPADIEWTYFAENPTDIYDPFVSSAQKLPNGNIIICSGVSARLIEINDEKETVWKYKVPIGAAGELFCLDESEKTPSFVFKVSKYPINYSGLGNLDDLGILQGEECITLNIDELNPEIAFHNANGKDIEVHSTKAIRDITIYNIDGSIRWRSSSHLTRNSVLIKSQLLKGISVMMIEHSDNSTTRKRVAFQ